MPPLSQNHKQVFEHILTENVKAALSSNHPEDKAVALGLEATAKDLEFLPALFKGVKVTVADPSTLNISYQDKFFESFLTRGRLAFYKGQPIEDYAKEKGIPV